MSSQTAGHFSGFTYLCKGLSAILVLGCAVVQIFPTATTYLSLIPARTIPFAWNLITAGYVEQSLVEVVVNVIGLLYVGKFLEPLWGSKEFFKFIFVVNFLTSICIFITAIALYYITQQEDYLYKPLSGFRGVLCGFLVAVKQIIPDQELGILKIKIKWVPSFVVLISIVICILMPESASFSPTIIFGTYMSWMYLRYLQKKPETSLRGDPSGEFSFSSFFPEYLRPIVDPVVGVFDRVLCGKSRSSSEPTASELEGNPLPGSDPIEATRRRERGARALDERLAAEKALLSGGRSDTSTTDVVDSV